MPLTNYKNGNVHYTCTGNGPALVLLHGFLENATIWDALTPQLATQNTVIAIDLLGHGQTDCFGYVHTMENMADAIYNVLITEGITQAAFTGHSMGGYAALAFLEKYPQMVTKLMLLNSVATPDTEEKKLNRDRGIKVVKQSPDSYKSMAVANLFSAAHREEFATEIEALKTEVLKTPLQGVINALEGMKIRKDATQLLKDAAIPKHYIIGLQDPTIVVDQIIAQAETVGATTTLVNGGHMSFIENKEETLQAMLRFF